MSDIKTDAWFRLIRDVLDAAERRERPEVAEASRLTLLGKLPPRVPHIPVQIETPYIEVPAWDISPTGKVVYLGIERNGSKDIIEWTVIDRRWTSRVVDSTGSEMHVDHLHYPEESEDVAFSVTRPDGKTRVFWGDWNFDANEVDSSKMVDIYCHLVESGPHWWPHCLVTYSRGEEQYIQKFQQGGGGREDAIVRLIEKVRAKELKVLGRRPGGQFIILAKSAIFGQSVRQSIILLDLKKIEDWESDQYDQILLDSIMERDGELSFVAYDNDGYIYHVGLAGHEQIREGNDRIKNALSPEEAVVCLPSGRILMREYEEGRVLGLGNEAALVRAPGTHFLRDIVTDERIELEGADRIDEIVELDGGDIAILTINRDSGRCLLIFHQREDGSWCNPSGFPVPNTKNLRWWGGKLVFVSTFDADRPVLRVFSWERFEDSSSHDGRFTIVGIDDREFQLHTSFDRLVPTDEGAIGCHFVDGTMYIIRYPL